MEESSGWQQRAAELESALQSLQWAAAQEQQQLVDQTAAIVRQLEEAQEAAAAVPQLQAELAALGEEAARLAAAAEQADARVEAARAETEREAMGQLADLAGQLEDARAAANQVGVGVWGVTVEQSSSAQDVCSADSSAALASPLGSRLLAWKLTTPVHTACDLQLSQVQEERRQLEQHAARLEQELEAARRGTGGTAAAEQDARLDAALREARAAADHASRLEQQLAAAGEERRWVEARSAELEAELAAVRSQAQQELADEVANLSSRLEEARSSAAEASTTPTSNQPACMRRDG